MTVDLILHGVPNGQDIWGAIDDRHYFSTFYRQQNEREYLSIEARKVNGKAYCYYNYLRYNNIVAFDERAGAYLGITLRIDAYYKDILNMYQICEIIYHNLFDSILKKREQNIQFIIPKFEIVGQELNNLQRKVINLIQLSATARDFVAINDSFFVNSGTIAPVSMQDCTPENILQVLQKYSKINISKYYPSTLESKRQQEIEERYKYVISEKDNALTEKIKQVERLKERCSLLELELNNERTQNERLNKLISEKEYEIKQIDEYKKQLKGQNIEIIHLKEQLRQKENENKKSTKTLNMYGYDYCPDIYHNQGAEEEKNKRASLAKMWHSLKNIFSNKTRIWMIFSVIISISIVLVFIFRESDLINSSTQNGGYIVTDYSKSVTTLPDSNIVNDTINEQIDSIKNE